METRIRALHWANLGTKAHPLEGQLFALWPAPVQHDRCFAAAGFTDFSDGGEAWDEDYERLIAVVLAVLGEHGQASVHAEALEKRPGLLERLRLRRAEVATPLQQLLWADFDDNSPIRVAFGAPARAFVQRSDGHEILWIWLHRDLAATWPALLGRAAGDVPVVQTDLAWDHLLPEELK